MMEMIRHGDDPQPKIEMKIRIEVVRRARN